MASTEGTKAKESNMQFVVSKQNLQKELGYVQGVVEKKNTIPTSLTQKCSGCATASYDAKSTFAQTTAASVPASSSSELSKTNRAIEERTWIIVCRVASRGPVASPLHAP